MIILSVSSSSVRQSHPEALYSMLNMQTEPQEFVITAGGGYSEMSLVLV